MSKILRTVALASTLALALTVPATTFAADNSNCWGVVTSQFATIYQAMGEHSSSFAGEARLGLGNVARIVLGDDATLGDLGQALGSIDGLSGTSCP